MNISLRLQQIEEEIGHLSPVQKILPGTDGSVTRLLEAITGKQIVISTRLQEIISATPAIAQKLGIPALLRVMRDSGAACAGMSSFGPTLFAIGDSNLHQVNEAVLEHIGLLGGGTTILTRARNTGASVRCMGT